MIEYVVGFAFSADHQDVVLIRKNRPEWMKGKWNGVGGKIEPSDESSFHAMSREFWEETGLEIPPDSWKAVTVLRGEESIIYVFKAVGNGAEDIYGVYTVTDEAVEVFNVKDLALSNYRGNYVSNLRWLIPLAAGIESDTHDVSCIQFTRRT